MWRILRIGILLGVLVLVAGNTLLDRLRSTDWDKPLRVGIFPVVADDSEVARRHVATLRAGDFAAIETFLAREARLAGVALERPAQVTLYPTVPQRPPLRDPRAGALATGLWSLRLRAYVWRTAGGTPAQIRLFVLYHDPARSPVVPHSLGLQKGLVGIVHAFAADDMTGANQVVIAHELLHTLGATDKYDPASGLPRWPDGFAQPQASPRYPQRRAEIMAGRRALSASEAETPDSLEDAVVGPATAREIRWRTD